MLRAAEAAVDAALEAAPHLSGEQRDAVRSAATRDGVVLIEAGAGTGKTTTAQALVDAAHRSGLKVVGLSPSWVAADELAASTGIAAQAIARWRHDRAHDGGAPLDDRTLVILDEAGMVGTRDMEAVLTAARDAGSKVALVGDRRQLASVARASALRAVADSPDFDPFENAFAKLKAILRARPERSIGALWDAVGAIVELFSPNECANYLKAAGYDPD